MPVSHAGVGDGIEGGSEAWMGQWRRGSVSMRDRNTVESDVQKSKKGRE